ncbi:hypothetical protein BABINDRAFT_162974 [Babjeviella inositovora NRRL Y-12698]|uniref:Dipeptidyl-peptidase IV n=1 Tax=Babjeviella inositovora NRRL Y-12698 TaxID=984486 RepID=A0A1E3QL09_9ASCO|nr:uncharacterized protein BABINDRAFT_162974 [Babjeviella inositovora NRRL Y-12698]ODQ78340.1 hypothetical protein BABINDRAFT_162974 [Babjeviella inositovora NRRL Y-12698]
MTLSTKRRMSDLESLILEKPSPRAKKRRSVLHALFRSKLFSRNVIVAGLLITVLWGSAFLIFAISYLQSSLGASTLVVLTPWAPGEHTVSHSQSHKLRPLLLASQDGLPLTLEAMRSRKFSPNHKSIQWIVTDSNYDSGSYVMESESEYTIKSVRDSSHVVLYKGSTITYKEEKYTIGSFEASSDLKYALITTDKVPNWRHSSFAFHWLLNIETQQIEPLFPNKPKAGIAVAQWSPKSSHVAFVLDNNVYIRDVHSEEVVQSTTDGGEDIFYGRPDWVYEEEVFSGASAIWWSPSGDFFTFLRTDDALVPEFPIPYFVQHEKDQPEADYPEVRKIKYPKPGYPNPIVSLMVYTVAQKQTAAVPSPDKHSLITEVTWVGAGSFLVKLTNRESDVLQISLVDAASASSAIVRKEDASGKEGGWFEITQETLYVPKDADNGRAEDGYIDTVVVDGYNHLAYFSPPSNPKGVTLTSGAWEVVEAPAAFDHSRNTVYFLATKRSAMDRHLYSVGLDGSNFANLTDTSTDGWYLASFSTGARYAVLSYSGPNVPSQALVDFHDHSQTVLETNPDVAKALQEYAIPSTTFETIKLGEEKEYGEIWANSMEIKPPSFDPTKKYPVLFYVYGGPNSQLVTKNFAVGFSHVISSALDAIVVTVDGRGTGFMGRKFRAIVRDNLGHYEARDQISAAKLWAKRAYVDETRIGIWGWSYGGFMTLKTLETDAGNTFRYGMSVAPVTTWRFYDSIYTERYMHTPDHNAHGYQKSAVTNVTAIAQASRFLLMHGTGDDNVHFQHSLRLLDLLDLDGVENYDVHVFPDSTHSISHHNANTIVYDKLFTWIRQAFDGDFEEKPKKVPEALAI